MSAAIHPFTDRTLKAFAASGAPGKGLPLEDFRALANAIVDAASAPAVGAELIALARRMLQVGLRAFAEQLVVLAGLALGDSAAGGINRAPPSGTMAAEAIKKLSAARPEGSVRGGPLAQVTVLASLNGESKCPVTRVTNKLRRLSRF